MDSMRSDPVRISSSVSEMFSDQCSLDERCGDWQELEQFWGEEKQRLQEVDGQVKPLSSSLEEHLMHDEFLGQPSDTAEKRVHFSEVVTVRGEDVVDVPTVYNASGFQKNELIVIGTYVDKNIIPGFRYKVRKSGKEEYLFDGKAKFLESIGLGYGKRLTFEGDSLNENENYFWSDSRDQGYAFNYQALSQEDVFTIVDITTNQDIGRVLVNVPALSPDVLLSSFIGESGHVEKEFQVEFSCDVILNDHLTKQNIFVENVMAKGNAVLVRNSTNSKARSQRIMMQDFVVDSCMLLPEE